MRKLLILVVSALLTLPATVKAQDNVIGKQNIKLNSRLMTPEALWNKSHQVLYVMNADGSGQQLLTKSAKSETDATWLDAQTIAFISGGEVWCMKADGSDRRQLSKTDGNVEGFKFSPDRQKVILIKSLPFHEIIKKNPDDLPKATGRRVTDLMYRHWDHYVESIQHPFLCSVSDYTIAADAKDILEGEPYECPMEPFGGIEQLAWSPDSKTIAYTCRKKKGIDYATSTDSDIYLYHIGTGKTRNLCKAEGYVEPAYDPSHTRADQAVNAHPQVHCLAVHGTRRI